MVDIPGTAPRPASAFPPTADGPPTRLRRDESSVATARQLIDTVSIPRLSLTVEREGGKATSRTVLYDGDLCRIGTHSSNDLVLQDPAVSRFHCRLVREEGAWRVRDWGSLNGTRLENVRIRDADLPVDATLALGDSIVRVRAVAPAGQAVVPMIPAFGQLAGTSVPMRKLFALLEKVAPSDINVLIEGESGTGKELVANEIGQRSPRVDKPFVVVDCGAISPNLVETELFGHVRGSFTGADRDRVGAFEAADGGTVFLDEVGELPLELQPKLLRALEAREIRRVGETRAAQGQRARHQRDQPRPGARGEPRALPRGPVLPPRRDDGARPAAARAARRSRILVRVFLPALGVPDQERLFTPQVLTEMARHDWPGNVRELRNYIERSVVLQKAGPAIRRSTPGGGVRPAAAVDIAVPFKIAKDGVDRHVRARLPDRAARGGRQQHEQGGAHGRHGPHVPAPPRAEARPARRRRGGRRASIGGPPSGPG